MKTLFERLKAKVRKDHTWHYINPNTKKWLGSLCEMLEEELADKQDKPWCERKTIRVEGLEDVPK